MSGIRVSDRALICFLERRGGFKFEPIRRMLETALDHAHQAADQMGAEDYLITVAGTVFVVRNGTVTTVVDDKCAGQKADLIRHGDGRD